MEIEPAIAPGILLSDGVIKDAMSGKLTAVNLFSQMNALALPFQSLPFFVTALISGLTGPIEKLTLEVSIINADTNAPVMNLPTQVAIPQGVTATDVNEMVWSIPPLFFTQAGAYDIVISAEKKEIGRRRFYVRSVSQAQLIKASP
jgi:hypothetical protein